MKEMQIDRNVLFAYAVFVKQHDTRQKANITLAAVILVTEPIDRHSSASSTLVAARARP